MFCVHFLSAEFVTSREIRVFSFIRVYQCQSVVKCLNEIFQDFPRWPLGD
jgi:hypothetical protein